jgi:hypothetical protein
MNINLNNGLGRPKFVKKFSSLYEFSQKYLFPEEDKLIALKEEVYKKEKELKKAKGRVNIQNQKVERAREWQRHFTK